MGRCLPPTQDDVPEMWESCWINSHSWRLAYSDFIRAAYSIGGTPLLLLAEGVGSAESDRCCYGRHNLGRGNWITI
jgi:hypothetical protein